MAAVEIAVGILETALAIQLAVLEGTDVLVAFAVDHHALAVRFALAELPLKAAAVAPLQLTQTVVLALFEFASVFHILALQVAFAVGRAIGETAFVAAAVAVAQAALAMEVAVLEFAGIGFTVFAVPFTGAIELPVLELPGVVAAVAVIQAPRALQQAVDHLAAVAPAVRQYGIGWQQGFAIATGDQQQGEAQRSQTDQRMHAENPHRKDVAEYALNCPACRDRAR